LRAYGDAEDLEVGDTLFETGEPGYDLIVIEPTPMPPEPSSRLVMPAGRGAAPSFAAEP
jgi:hypothetical protein